MSTHWEEKAACAGSIPELWFGPEDYDEPRDQARWRQRRATEICATCPVRTECLADELVRPLSEQHGIRGGLTPRARERLLSQWREAGLVPEHGPTADIETVLGLLEDDDAPRPARLGDRSEQPAEARISYPDQHRGDRSSRGPRRSCRV